MTDKQLLQAFNDRFHPSNISELARLIGKSQQYVSKCILRRNAAQQEKQEPSAPPHTLNICEYLKRNCPRLVSIEGLPDNEAIAAMQSCTGGDIEKVKKVLQKIENVPDIHKLGGSLYTVAFGQYV